MVSQPSVLDSPTLSGFLQCMKTKRKQATWSCLTFTSHDYSPPALLPSILPARVLSSTLSSHAQRRHLSGRDFIACCSNNESFGIIISSSLLAVRMISRTVCLKKSPAVQKQPDLRQSDRLTFGVFKVLGNRLQKQNCTDIAASGCSRRKS